MGGCGALPKDQGEFVLDQGLGPGGREAWEGAGDGVCDTHWWAYTSRWAGWGCPRSRRHSWGRQRVVRGIPRPPTPYGLLLPAPTGSRSPLTAAACVAWGTRVTRGLAVRVQEAGVREPVGMRRTGRGAGLQ